MVTTLKLHRSSLESLKKRLFSDIVSLGFPLEEVSVYFRPFSKTFYGRYFIEDKKIFIYPYKNKKGEFLEYSHILGTFIHEFCHHMQFQDSSYKRKRGVMHNADFWRMYNSYKKKAKSLGIEVTDGKEIRLNGS